jgi:hypothetical protein
MFEDPIFWTGIAVLAIVAFVLLKAGGGSDL